MTGMIYKRYIKRMLDILFSCLGIVALSPVMLCIALAVYLYDFGSVFYIAPRIGYKSRPFNMVKFRTMKMNAPDYRNADGSTFNSRNDNRVTPVGKILRATSLDELGQLFNIVKGDMSIIGPRASVWNALDTYLPDELEKMSVRPGLTGYTQAYFRNSLTLREKRLKDVEYARNVSFWGDVRIFCKTIQMVLSRKNLYTNQ